MLIINVDTENGTVMPDGKISIFVRNTIHDFRNGVKIGKDTKITVGSVILFDAFRAKLKELHKQKVVNVYTDVKIIVEGEKIKLGSNGELEKYPSCLDTHTNILFDLI